MSIGKGCRKNTLQDMNKEENDITIEYYNRNASMFNNDTLNADLNEIQAEFLSYLENKAYILDFGCGSGRDTKSFVDKGYNVDAIDGSVEMCNIASVYTGINVRHVYFNELNETNKYDGVWACSSILHLPYNDLRSVMKKIFTALKEEGILYASFKYGEYEGFRSGRYFTDMNEIKIHNLLSETELFDIAKLWVTNDVRPGRSDEKWLNMILRRKTVML